MAWLFITWLFCSLIICPTGLQSLMTSESYHTNMWTYLILFHTTWLLIASHGAQLMSQWLVLTSWAINSTLKDNFDCLQLCLAGWLECCDYVGCCFTHCLIMLLDTKQCAGEGTVGGLNRMDLSLEAWCLHPPINTGHTTLLVCPYSSRNFFGFAF